ncbi:hypothetical protein [Aminicella lysinilytica]|uniref:hypothetical protein n=1 Tax=Aminicella lysinilytica TaxID=433323 RepID=UPI0026F16E78|nr:hypothetical protein [Aminicella lysinilytica]
MVQLCINIFILANLNQKRPCRIEAGSGHAASGRPAAYLQRLRESAASTRCDPHHHKTSQDIIRHHKTSQSITYSAGKYTQRHICDNGNVLRSFFRIWKFVGTVVSNDLVGAGTGGDVLHASNSNKSGNMAGREIRAGAPMESMHDFMHDRSIGGTIGQVVFQQIAIIAL